MLSKTIIFSFLCLISPIISFANDFEKIYQEIRSVLRFHSYETFKTFHKNNMQTINENYNTSHNEKEIFTQGYKTALEDIFDDIDQNYIILHKNCMVDLDRILHIFINEYSSGLSDELYDQLTDQLYDQSNILDELLERDEDIINIADSLIDQNNDILEDNHLLIKENRALIFQSNVNMGIGYLAGAISGGLFSYIVAISHIQNK